MNHLLRELAPITETAWSQIDEEASRSLKHFLAARRLVDFSGPHGWDHSAVDLGRVHPLEADALGGVEGARRRVLPLVELRATMRVEREELVAADRGATDLDLDDVRAAGRAAALAEDRIVFDGYEPAGIEGIVPSSPHPPVAISSDYSEYPEHVARAVALLRGSDVAGPYGIALGPRCYTGVTETTEHGGYPVLEHLRQLLDGPVVWAPSVDGAVVLSLRGGDFELTVGEDFAVGYRSSDVRSVELYIEETVAFQVNTPEAAVHLSYQSYQ
ncbi:MAG: bacteriocin family protein [Acidimicrobiales bacterium]|nr:bacteriocin family protein [Acidimicrobiales bacterium]